MPHETLRPISADLVPGYGLLNNFDWIEDFWTCEEIRKKNQALGVRKKELRNTPSTKESFKTRLQDSFNRYQERRKAWLTRYLKGVERSHDPLSRFESSMGIEYFVFLTFDEIETALNEMEFDSGISDMEREDQLSQINTQRAKLEDELKSLSPEKYFSFVNGSCVGDIRVLFVRHWMNMQARCNAPCNPCGITLDQSPGLEKRAYEQLRIAKAINHGSRLMPYVAR